MADTIPLKLLLLTVSGWVHRHQQDTIAYLLEENRILKEKHGGKCPRLNDDQRRRLAALAKRLGRRTLNQVATIVTPVPTENAVRASNQPVGCDLEEASVSRLSLGYTFPTERAGN